MKNSPSNVNNDNLNGFMLDRRKVLGAMGVVALGFLPNKGLASNAARNTKDMKVLTFTSLKDAKESSDVKLGNLVKTLGYHVSGDGGFASYLISKGKDDVKANEGDVVQFKGGLVGVLVDVDCVNYKMFGAVSDSENDDGDQIKLAHEYANRNKLPVINYSGEYWIKKARNIQIQTPVQWGQSIFHINEAYNTKNAVFRILSFDKPVSISLDDATKKKLIEKIKPGVQQILELREYKNSLILIKDDKDRIGFRAGERFAGQSRAKEELFYVEEDGKILGDIAWTFKDYTDLTAYPAENSYLVIDGGTFYLTGDNPGLTKMGYFQNGFSVTRSRTIIQNQWVGLEKGKSDIAFNPRNGFYNFNSVYDITLENIRLIPWEQDRPGKERDLYAGTYGIGGNRTLNTTFRNITAEGSLLHWGVFGTNMNKNFKIEACRLNRVDVHFHCWNLTIKDTHIGNRGISITGGGELIIENTTNESSSFVNFRRDFGAKWDGNISIRNCRLKPLSLRELSVLYFIAGDFDYRYPIGLAHNISVENFVVDYTSIPANQQKCWLVRTSNFSISHKGERLFFPKNMIFKNVSVTGREKGLRLLELPDPQLYTVPKTGSYDGTLMEANSLMEFDTIQLEKNIEDDKDPYHIELKVKAASVVYDKNSIYPKVKITNCDNFSGYFGEIVADILIENSIINTFHTPQKKNMQGEVLFTNCKFLPHIASTNTNPYLFMTDLGTSFTNCVFYLPRKKNQASPEFLSLLNFININKSVMYNHLNSRLGKDVLKHYKAIGVKINSSFIGMLKSHHELEDSNF